MKRVNWRQAVFAITIVTTAFFAWTYAADSTPWQSAGFVYEALASTGPAINTTLSFAPAVSGSQPVKSPVKLVFEPHNNWDPNYAYELYYRITDADSAVIAEGMSSNASYSTTLTAKPGQTATYTAEFHSYVHTGFGYQEPTQTVTFSVYAPKLTTTMTRPVGPATTRTTINTKVTGSIYPGRTAGSTSTVRVRFYRWEKRSGTYQWVFKKSAWAKMTTSRAWAVSTKLTSKGSWSAIASAASDASRTSATSSRSRTISVR